MHPVLERHMQACKAVYNPHLPPRLCDVAPWSLQQAQYMHRCTAVHSTALRTRGGSGPPTADKASGPFRCEGLVALTAISRSFIYQKFTVPDGAQGLPGCTHMESAHIPHTTGPCSQCSPSQ
jgi:hypothetical protein